MLNQFSRISWPPALNAWIVVSDLTKNHDKGSGDNSALPRHPSSRLAALSVRCGLLAPLLGMAIAPAQATDYYWDINGILSGSGGPTPNGTWSTTATTLSLDAAGTVAVLPHTTGTADRLFFSAATDATGPYTVTVSGTQNIGRLTFQEGAVNLTGGTINFGAVSGLIEGDATPDSISSVLSGTGGVRFSGGTVTLNGTAANTYTGTTQVGGAGLAQAAVNLSAPGGNAVSGNFLQIGGNNGTGAGFVTLGAANQINDTATVQMNSGHYSGSSIFSMNGFNETLGGINLHHQGEGSGVTFRNGAATDATVTLAGSGTYTTGSGDRTYGRSIQNGGAGRLNVVVALTGSGSQTMAGTDPTYTGTTTVNSGTLRLWNTSLWASNATLNGGTLELQQTSAGTGYLAGAASRIHANTIGGTGGTLRKTGNGTIILSGANTYQGATSIQAGTLQAGSTSAFGSNSAVTLANVAGATLNLNGFNNSIGSLAGGGGAGGNVNLGAATLTTGGDNTSTFYGGSISGTGGLTKSGAGTQTLTGASSYTGATTVAAGTLRVNGSTGASLVMANAGSTFGGNGVVGGPVTIASGATLDAGPAAGAVGTLTLSALTMGATSQLTYDLGEANVAGGANNDLVQVNGNLTLGGVVNVNAPGGAFADMLLPGSYRLINYTGALAGSTAIGSIPSGFASSQIQTIIPGEVNLIAVQNGVPMQFWDGTDTAGDGTVDGGTSAWNNSTGNWTNAPGNINQSWIPGVGIFTGTAGVVTLAVPVSAMGLQFVTNGYQVASSGAVLTMVALPDTSMPFIRVDAGATADIGAPIAGTDGLMKADAGTLVLSGTNSYTGGTVIAAGRLQLGNGGTTGSIVGDVINNAVLVFNRSDVQSSTGSISGAGAVMQAGTGTTILTADNSYSGGTTIAAGTLQLGNGGTTGSIIGDIVNNGALAFNRSDTRTMAGVIGGTGTVDQNGSGNTILTGLNGYTGTTTVNAGGLFINGNQAAASGQTDVNGGATLGGIGTIGGNVNVASGATLGPGDVGAVPGTLTINQNLTLNSGSMLEYSFGQANVVGGAFNDLTVVSGDLVLDGTLNVVTSPGGSFDTGIYRVISYDGNLTNSGLVVGTVPTPTFLVQTSVANQVNLVNTNGLALNFWDGNAGPKMDGAVNGGDGVWQNFAGNDNWTEETGLFNVPFVDAGFAIFMANPGTVAVDNSLGAVKASGMQFATDGYVMNGDPLALVGAPSSTIRVGDGTVAGAGYTARIEADLTGTTRLVKTDLGSLVLSGTNSYSGGTAIRDGVIEIARDTNLGAAAGSVAFTNNGTLHTTASLATGRSVDFTAGNGTLLTDATTTLTLSGPLTGAGNLTKGGQGTLLLTGSDTHSGTTTVRAGTLTAGGANVLSAASAHTVLGGATLDLDGHVQTIAALDNAGLVRFTALGTTLNLAGNYTGNGGTLQLDTALGTDTSATDLLRVGGNTSGTSTLKVSNAGGTGGQTVEGIRLVDVVGVSNGTFSLAGDFVFEGEQAVIGGAYAYRLYKNGVSTPADGDWYLRSQLTNPQSPGELPLTPLYQPGAPLYESYAQILLGLNGLPTLRQRVGNRYWSGAGNGVIEQGDGPGVAEAAPMPSEGGRAYVDQRALWTRIDAAHMKAEPNTSTGNADYDYDVWNLQSGFDGKLYENDSGMLIGGITGRYGKASADISSTFGTGSIDTEGYGLGASLTWYGQNGFYVDSQVQTTWYDSDLFSDTIGRSLVDSNDGFGYALSVETGRRLAVDQKWTVTPQAQLVYSTVDYDTFSDPFNARVALDSGDSLKGRLGVSAEYQNAWADDKGRLRRASLYGIANLYYEFLDGTQVDVSTVHFASANDRLWGGTGAGGSYNWADDKYALFGEVSVNTSLASFGDSYSLNGSAGFRVKW